MTSKNPITESDLDEAGAWIAGRLTSMLDNLPESDPMSRKNWRKRLEQITEPEQPRSMALSDLLAARWSQRSVGTWAAGLRGKRGIAGKNQVPTNHIMARFERVL